MQYTSLRGDRLRVSRVGIGTFNTVSRQADMNVVVDAALDVGITLFDTAESYRNGGMENMLGKALGGKRDQAIIATKWGLKESELPASSPNYIVQACERSLKRLGTDRIDLYQYHHFDRSVPIEDTLGALQALQQQGKIIEYGLSNVKAPLFKKVVAEAKRAGAPLPVTSQEHYSYLHRDVEEDFLATLNKEQACLLAYYPLEAGLLTGKYRQGETPASGTRLGRKPDAPAVQKRLQGADWPRIAELDDFASSQRVTVGQAALAWILRKQEVASVLAGATSAEQVKQNAEAAALAQTLEFPD
ncbi:MULTISPECIES: aldo/keto reductase [unclassified Sphingobium]|uniref:aldo/keto reductase n=1 Tax=unclassified Sphingobium TaxID=2611147 RepID=UPI0035A6BE31